MSKTVGIIGLGLLGGSLAKALKAYTDYEVVGYARRQEVCDAAIQDGVVKAAWTEVEPLIKHSDIVVFSLPPDTNARLFTETAHLFRPGQVVTDVSSAKENFAHAVYDSIPKGTIFVSVHPMAVYSEEVAQELADMGRALGSRIEFVDIYAHDAYLAMVSHMPHLLASILTQVSGGDELGELRMKLSAGGFRDCTRVAGGLPSMWREIIYGNRRNVIEGLTQVEAEIQRVKEILLQEDDGQELEIYLERSREIRGKLPYLTGQIKDN
ncbi:prephenate dehydrogenase [Veillonella parvula]|uniref:prephenate dehydrogenase n=1 Tax=Veillonella parvula TaxID=29466 RepID=UPI0028FE7A82|nr:prephenate dehydrogenase [Veillonella parvula]MDU3191434.1 prephenate dehydrogenase [Veillonella parvula]